ncbi:MAG: YbaB/EbfC family nucleoid-associated protein [bacterium]
MIFGNVGDILGKVKKMQEDMKEVQKELSQVLVEEDSGGVKVVVSGDMELRDFKLDPKIFENKDIKRVEWLISDAVDKAFAKAKKEAANKLKKVTGGLSIPGLF